MGEVAADGLSAWPHRSRWSHPARTNTRTRSTGIASMIDYSVNTQAQINWHGNAFRSTFMRTHDQSEHTDMSIAARPSPSRHLSERCEVPGTQNEFLGDGETVGWTLFSRSHDSTIFISCEHCDYRESTCREVELPRFVFIENHKQTLAERRDKLIPAHRIHE